MTFAFCRLTLAINHKKGAFAHTRFRSSRTCSHLLGG